jgi:hypothetical protein
MFTSLMILSLMKMRTTVMEITTLMTHIFLTTTLKMILGVLLAICSPIISRYMIILTTTVRK